MAAVLDRVHRIPLADEPRRHMPIAIGVLARPVGDHDDGAGLPVREPVLPEDAQAAGAGQGVIAQGPDSSAQGTTTASSWGESRATTYSAGSLSDRFSSTWVSRGGT